MTRDLNICCERLARVSEKLLVFFRAIRVDDIAADLRVPAVLCASRCVEVDRVTIFARVRSFSCQRAVLVEIPRRHLRARDGPAIGDFPTLFADCEIEQTLLCVETG